ncbi:uncharacterized protein LOC126858150 [Cataglyphis hispanica]|uniref:uncharacterized protein LOC126858150 n=1 Tax=Cataglyphis hispanica TaxID=1086592 RepID=UPI002180732D|nr:uncharacterized protein LOC126858150 [Cataglyphis hispanica]
MRRVKQRTKKIMRLNKGSDTQIHRNEINMFFRKLQQVVEESRNDQINNGQISQDRTLIHTNNKKKTLPEKDSTFVQTNICNESHNNYTCRCKYFSEIPSNVFPPFYKRIPSFLGQYEVEVNFIQAIVWLKSVTASITQIPVEKLQQLFDKQCNMRDNYNYDENRQTKDVHVESSLTIPINKTPSIEEMLNNSEVFITSSSENIFDSSCNIISPMIYKSFIDPEDIQSETFDFKCSSKDRNESIAELSKPEASSGYVMKNQKKKKEFLSKSYINPDLNEDSLSDLNDLFEESDDMQEYQSFKHKRISSKNSKKRTPREENKANNFQTDQVQSKTLHDYNDDGFEYDINDSLCSLTSDIAAEKQDHDSAYSTWKIETFNYDAAITTKSISANKCISDANIGCHYNLRSRKKHVEVTVSPSLIQKSRHRRLSAGKRSSSKKCKSAKDLSKKKKGNKDEIISSNWLDFTVEVLNSEHVILTSIKVILSTLFNKRTAQEYAVHRCWKDSLEEQAVNAILNVVDILRLEKKSDICTKEIEKAIVETLDEMLTSLELNETSIWIYRIQIILKFCNLLPICIKTINYLLTILGTLQDVLIKAENENERTTEIEINQLHLISYALDMTLRTYRILVPRNKNSQCAISYIGNRWKMRYRIENKMKLEDTSFDLDVDVTEKKWIDVLQKFTVVSVKHLIQFSDISFSLYHILISA